MIISLIIRKLSKLQKRQRRKRRKSYEGFTLIELLIAMAIVGILAALVAANINFGINPLRDTTNRIAGDFKLVRAKAMSQTSTYRVRPASAGLLTVERRAASCSVPVDATNPKTVWTVDPSFTTEDLSLNEASDVKGLAKNTVIEIASATVNGAAVTPVTNWAVCYDSRGVANTNLVLILRNTNNSQQKGFEIFPGGGVYVY